MTDHAPLAPSAAHRWARCPGSVRMTKDTHGKPNRAALRGTAMHQVLEACLKKNKRPEAYLDYVFSIEEEDVSFDDDMVKWTTETFDWVLAYKKEHPKSTLIAEAKLQAGKVLDEELTDEIWGTADVLVYSKDELLVLDLKGGYIDVSIEDNYQLILYAIGAVAHFEDAMEIEPIRFIRLVIHQPRTGGAKELVVGRETLDEWGQFLKKAAKEALSPKAPLRSSDEACKWCPAIGYCPSAHSRAIELARNTDWPEVAESITEEQLVTLLERTPYIRKFLEAAESYAFTQLSNGHQIPGFKLVAKNKHRKWADETQAGIYLTKELGEKAWKRNIITPAQAEKLLDKETLAKYIIKPEGEPELAPSDDPRPTIPFRELRVIEGTKELVDIKKAK